MLDVAGFGVLDASMVDAANACVFVRARDIGLTGSEMPEANSTARPEMLRLLNDIRCSGSVRMGIAPDVEAARAISIVPFVAFVSPPADGATLSGDTVKASAIDLAVRVVSNGQPHRALPLTVSLCAAVAARVPGTLVAEALSPTAQDGPLRLGMPSGVLTVGADVVEKDCRPMARAGSFYRTARRLFDGRVWVPDRVAS